MTYRICAALAFGTMLFSSSAGAHHNMSALFDFNNRVTLTGTLSKVDWRNPHIQLMVDGKNGQEPQVETWAIEGPPPSFFRTRDTTKADFEEAIGKTLTVEASRARDGSHAGLLRIITLPSGKVVSACPQNC